MHVIIWYAKVLGLFVGAMGMIIISIAIANLWPELMAVICVGGVITILEILRRA